MSAGLPPETLDRLREWFAARPEVDVAALFGSAARGRMHAGSDVDVFVRLRRGAAWDWRDKSEIEAELERRLRREVDLVVEDPDATSVILRLDVARTGLLLHEGRPGAWVTLRADAMVAYADLEPYIRRCAEGVRSAILRRASVGA